jgi:hypothetical protein
MERKNAAGQSFVFLPRRMRASRSSLLNAMTSRRFQKLLIGAVATALCVYAGLYVYKSQRYASAFAETRVGDSPEIVSNRFGAPPNIEFPHSGYFMGFTKFPCAPPCETRLSWNDPASVFRQQAYYFEFDVNRHLISKTHYQHLDEAYLRSQERWKEGMKRMREAGLDWSSTEADRFRAAKVVAVVRLLEPPQLDPRDSSWGPLSKFLVLHSWKGPFPAGATITVATSAMCYGPSCTAFLAPKQVGQSVMILSLGDAQPIYPMMIDGIDVDKKTRELDTLATQTGT